MLKAGQWGCMLTGNTLHGWEGGIWFQYIVTRLNKTCDREYVQTLIAIQNSKLMALERWDLTVVNEWYKDKQCIGTCIHK